jgi:hypothetical protein
MSVFTNSDKVSVRSQVHEHKEFCSGNYSIAAHLLPSISF